MRELFVRTFAVALVLTVCRCSAQTGKLDAVSAPLPATPSETPAGGSSFPVVSADGRYVAFVSRSQNIVTNSTGGHYQILLRDLASSNITLVSATPANSGGNDHSVMPSLSSNGLWIAFESEASDLVVGDTNRFSDIYVRDVAGGQTILVSRGNAPAQNPMISADGRYVAFESRATDLSFDDTNRAADVFIRDVVSGTTTLLSVNVAGTGTANRGSELLTMTPDGRFVAFWSSATDISADVINTTGEVYVRDMQSATTYCLTKNIREAYARRFRVALSPDGRYAAVHDLNDPGPPGQPLPANAGSVVRVDIFSGTITNIICCGRPGRGLAISDDGSRIVFYGRTFSPSPMDAIFMRDVFVSTNTPLVPNVPDIESFQVSQDFQHLFYTLMVTNRGYQLFAYDLVAHQTALISANSSGFAINAAIASPFSVDDSGEVIAFETAADDLLTNDLNRASDVFVVGRGLVAPGHPDLPARVGSGMGISQRGNVNATGERIAFVSADGALARNDTNLNYDVFLTDLRSNQVSNVGGFNATNSAIGSVLSADGNSMIFERFVGNEIQLALRQLYRADLRNGQVQVLASGFFSGPWQPSLSQDGRWMAIRDSGRIKLTDLRIPALSGQISNQVVDMRFDGTREGNGVSFNPAISLDGERIVFLSLATDLTTNAGYPANTPQAFVRDVKERRTRLLSIDSAGNPLIRGATNLALSADGRFAIYQTYYGSNVYRHDLSLVANTLVCSNCSAPSISGDGRSVAYQSAGQIYLADMQLGTAENLGGNQAKDAVISFDGRFVAYVSKDAGVHQVYLRDCWNSVTSLLSRNSIDGGPGNGPSYMPVISYDGRTIAFHSFASDLVPGDYNGRRDIFVVRVEPVDSDSDGMDDDWEMHYFGILDRDGSSDFDGDGVSDDDEYLAGTDPTDPGSILHLTGMRSATYGPVFDREVSWSSAPGKTYRLQHKVTLADPWTDLPGDITTGGPRGTASHLEHHDFAPRTGFYRLQLVE